MLKIQSAGEPWPGKPPGLRGLVDQVKEYVSQRGGHCSRRFADGVLWLAIRGLSAEQVSEMTAAWRMSIRKRNEPTTIEQFDGELMPPKNKASLTAA